MTINYYLEDIESVAKKVLKHLNSKHVLFSGEMGAGKTTLIKELVKQMGSVNQVSSPTFSLVNEYKASKHLIYHFDFYRIESEEEAFDMGFEEYLETAHYVFIEWPEKIPNLWPLHGNNIKLEAKKDKHRCLTLTEF